MDIESTENHIGIGILYLELVIGLCLNGTALCILFRKRKRTVGDLLLIHLSCNEMSIAAVEIVDYSLHLYWGTTSAAPKALRAVEFLVWTNQYLCVIYITLDRILAVYLTCRYKAIATKTKLSIAFVLQHLLSWGSGILIFVTLTVDFYVTSIEMVAFMCWDFLTIILTTGGYVYIILITRARRRILRNSSSNIPTANIKYIIPMCIAATFFSFVVIPDIVLNINLELYCIWFRVVWTLNFISDPLIYVVFYKYQGQKQGSKYNGTRDRDLSLSVISTTAPLQPKQSMKAVQRIQLKEKYLGK